LILYGLLNLKLLVVVSIWYGVTGSLVRRGLGKGILSVFGGGGGWVDFGEEEKLRVEKVCGADVE